MGHSRKRAALGQNFLVHGKTVRKLVQLAGFSGAEHVLEIGPGEGIITRELAPWVEKVTTIEVDPSLIGPLKNALSNFDNVEIRQGDFLKVKLPAEPYHIFSNIPFNLTAEIMHKLLITKFPPQSGFLIMQKETAEKFIGQGESTESSILFQPWFDFKYKATVNRFEFRPVPSVDAMLLGMRLKEKPLLDPAEKRAYQAFVAHGFRSWKKSLKIAYKSVFTFPQWKRLAKDNRFSVEAIPSKLSLEQWLALYRFFQTGVSPEKKRTLLQK